MDVAGKVNRTFTVNRIPPGRIGAAEKLNLQAIARGSPGGILADHFLGRFPGGPAGCAPFDSYALNLTGDYIGIHFG